MLEWELDTLNQSCLDFSEIDTTVYSQMEFICVQFLGIPFWFFLVQMETSSIMNGTRYYPMAVTPTRLYSFTGIGSLEVRLTLNTQFLQ